MYKIVRRTATPEPASHDLSVLLLSEKILTKLQNAHCTGRPLHTVLSFPRHSRILHHSIHHALKRKGDNGGTSSSGSSDRTSNVLSSTGESSGVGLAWCCRFSAVPGDAADDERWAWGTLRDGGSRASDHLVGSRRWAASTARSKDGGSGLHFQSVHMNCVCSLFAETLSRAIILGSCADSRKGKSYEVELHGEEICV